MYVAPAYMIVQTSASILILDLVLLVAQYGCLETANSERLICTQEGLPTCHMTSRTILRIEFLDGIPTAFKRRDVGNTNLFGSKGLPTPEKERGSN